MDTPSLPIPFAIGETVWWIGPGHRREPVTCPECAGTRAHTLTLGNGETVSIACEHCRSGYNPPQGLVWLDVYEYAPTPFVCGRIDISGDRIHYSESGPDATAYSSAYAADLFRDRDACLVRCAEKTAEQVALEAGRSAAIAESKRRGLSHSASYWRRQISDAEKVIADARARLSAIKHPKP